MITKEEKQKYRLPVKKELIYYKMDKNGDFSIKKNIIDLEIIRVFSEDCIFKVICSDGTTVKILGRFLSEMQSSDFHKKMKIRNKTFITHVETNETF